MIITVITDDYCRLFKILCIVNTTAIHDTTQTGEGA